MRRKLDDACLPSIWKCILQCKHSQSCLGCLGLLGYGRVAVGCGQQVLGSVTLIKHNKNLPIVSFCQPLNNLPGPAGSEAIKRPGAASTCNVISLITQRIPGVADSKALLAEGINRIANTGTLLGPNNAKPKHCLVTILEHKKLQTSVRLTAGLFTFELSINSVRPSWS